MFVIDRIWRRPVENATVRGTASVMRTCFVTGTNNIIILKVVVISQSRDSKVIFYWNKRNKLHLGCRYSKWYD